MLQFLGQVASAVGPISQILGAFRGGSGDAEPTMQPISDAESFAISMMKALTDPDNERIKQLESAEFRQIMRALGSGVRSKVLSDRRERAMGRGGTFFEPERADENIAYQLTRGAAGAKHQARQNVKQDIQTAARGVLNASTEDQRYRNLELARAAQDQTRLLGGGNPIQQILGAFGGGGQATGPMGQDIQWNTTPSNLSMMGQDIQWNQPQSTVYYE